MRIIKALATDISIFLFGILKKNKKEVGVTDEYRNGINKEKNPIIIIQGYLTTWDFIKHIADEISGLGYSVYLLPELKNNKLNIKKASEIVNKLIEKYNLKNSIIIGYSKGGLIGKYLLANYNKDNKIKGLISVATPYSGTKLASFFKFIKSNEFYSQHNLIKELETYSHVNKKIITISANHDSVIWHKKKGSLENAKENIYVDSYGHLGMIFDKKVIKEIISSIEKLSV